MVSLDLNESERELLKELLDNLLSDIRMEVADTDRMDYREKLKEQKRVLHKMIEALEDATG